MLELKQVDISFATQTIVKDIDLKVEENEIDCLLGASGCGKTSLLRAIAGFQPISQGSISLQNQIISTPDFSLAAEKRQIGMVFQDYALFPHLTVADNIAFGINHQSRQFRQRRINELLEMVQLSAYKSRYPHELSGGQQQRIALARALAPKPKLLLLDEPFGSQDVELREQLAVEVRTILKAEKITTLLVTHDQHEAYAIADKIGVMQNTKIVQWGSATELYHYPTNRQVADFIGEGSFIKGKVISATQVETAIGQLWVNSIKNIGIGEEVEVFIRPDKISLDTNSPIQTTIIKNVFRGGENQYTLQLIDGNSILIRLSSEQIYKIGDKLTINFDDKSLIVFAVD